MLVIVVCGRCGGRLREGEACEGCRPASQLEAVAMAAAVIGRAKLARGERWGRDEMEAAVRDAARSLHEEPS